MLFHSIDNKNYYDIEIIGSNLDLNIFLGDKPE